MAIERPCPTHLLCPTIVGPAGNGYLPDPDSPIANLSSEAPDPVDFLFTYFFKNDPPINAPPDWWSPMIGVGNGQGTTPDQARTNARNEATDNGSPGRTPVGNDEQTCEAECDDGNPSVHTVPANTYLALNQTLANAMAASACQTEAEILKVCFITTDLPGACSGEYYTFIMQATGGVPTITGNPYFWEVLSGTLPPGISLNATNGALTGFTSTGGNYTFTIQITDGNGTTQSKAFTITVIEITKGATLTSGVVSSAYINQLTANPNDPSAVWSYASGTLPSGLIIAPSGLISGTPTVKGDYTFTANLNVNDTICSKTFTLKVWAADNTLYETLFMSPGMVPIVSNNWDPGKYEVRYTGGYWIQSNNNPLTLPNYSVVTTGAKVGGGPTATSPHRTTGPSPGSPWGFTTCDPALSTAQQIPICQATTTSMNPQEVFDLLVFTASLTFTWDNTNQFCLFPETLVPGGSVGFQIYRVGKP